MKQMMRRGLGHRPGIGLPPAGPILLAAALTTVYPVADRAIDKLISRDVLETLSVELSGELAKDHVIAITRHHRIQGSRGYSDAAAYVLETLRGFGFDSDDAWIESFKSDGIVRYQTWQSPSGWSIESAELRMVEPRQELLVRYPEIAMSVITYSNPGQVRAELVDVGRGVSHDDYKGKDVAGKLVLASGYGGEVHRLAVLEYGAAAVVCYLDDPRAADHPDMTGYTGMWPRTEELPYVTFGFNLSNRQGRKLKELLAQGKRVVLEARVEGIGLEPGRMDVVVAEIRGVSEDAGQLIYTAHLDHPKESANDNASGSAALLDMARTFKTLLAKQALTRPRHTLRFLWVPEFFGTMAYIDAHPELRGPRLGGRALASLNLDMVGENLELLHSRLNITRPPRSISSALADVIAETAAQVDKMEQDFQPGGRSNFNYRMTPFSGGSDHVVFNDGMVGVPAMMLGHWPDYTHHTSEDTPDKVDPVELERVELIAAAGMWYLATMNETAARRLAVLVSERAQARLLEDTKKALEWLLNAPREQLQETYHEAKNVVEFALRRETEALQSILNFADAGDTRRLVDTFSQTLQGQAELQRRTLVAAYQQRAGRFPIPLVQTPDRLEADRWTPTRRTRGPLAAEIPERRLSEQERRWYDDPAHDLDRYLLVNFIDGRRSILDIRDNLSAATEPVPLEVVNHFIRDLAKVGVVELKRSP